VSHTQAEVLRSVGEKHLWLGGGGEIDHRRRKMSDGRRGRGKGELVLEGLSTSLFAITPNQSFTEG